MTRRTETIAPAYFDALYAGDADPWGFRTSAYEREKYQATLAALGKPRYERGLEVGCSIGVFTQKLALRCDRLVAIDASAKALEQARQACSAMTHVEFAAMMVPDQFPDGPFDLIVLSEMLYYLNADDLHLLAAVCGKALRAEGDIILCHWLGETDYPQSGRQASDLFAKAMLKRLPFHVILNDLTYRLDRLSSRAGVE